MNLHFVTSNNDTLHIRKHFIINKEFESYDWPYQIYRTIFEIGILNSQIYSRYQFKIYEEEGFHDNTL